MPYSFTNLPLNQIKADAIVSFTDSRFSLGNLSSFASQKLKRHCAILHSTEQGAINITPSYGFAAPNIIHAVVNDIQNDAEKLLACYRRILFTAVTYGWTSIAVPLLPQVESISEEQQEIQQVVLDAVREYSEQSDLCVYLVVEDKKRVPVDEGLLLRLQAYVNSRYRESTPPDQSHVKHPLSPSVSPFLDYSNSISGFSDKIELSESEEEDDDALEDDIFLHVHSFYQPPQSTNPTQFPDSDFDPYEELYQADSLNLHDDPRSDEDMDAIYYDRCIEEPRGNTSFGFSSRFHPDNNTFDLDESFSQAVIHLIDERGWSDPQCYSKANLSRAVFNKLKQSALDPWHVNYRPSKTTALALIVALELPLDEAEDLIKRAGYALSHSNRADVIVEYFLVNHMYDIDEINEVLFRFDQPLLGSV